MIGFIIRFAIVVVVMTLLLGFPSAVQLGGWWIGFTIGEGIWFVHKAVKGTVPRKQLEQRKIELIMAPTPRWRVDEQEMAHLANNITGKGTQDALPGKQNGAVTRYLIGEIDAYEMEEMLDARIADATTRERYNIPEGMGHSGPPKTRKER
jgi:hypothetical protein